jgi:hypothetical protein
MQSCACAGSVIDPRTAEGLAAPSPAARAPSFPVEITTTTPAATSWFTAWHSGD